MTINVAMTLAVVAALTTSTLAVVEWSTRERIEAARQQQLIDRLGQIIPASIHNNNMLEDTIALSHTLLGTADVQTIWRARMDNSPVAAVLSATAPNGYGGPIELLVGIKVDGEITAVRVLQHKETPGLGDDVEITRSDWIKGFDEQSLLILTANQWRVRQDSGVFDQFTGATITPRAIVSAVYSALIFFDQNQEAIFATEQ